MTSGRGCVTDWAEKYDSNASISSMENEFAYTSYTDFSLKGDIVGESDSGLEADIESVAELVSGGQTKGDLGHSKVQESHNNILEGGAKNKWAKKVKKYGIMGKVMKKLTKNIHKDTVIKKVTKDEDQDTKSGVKDQETMDSVQDKVTKHINQSKWKLVQRHVNTKNVRYTSESRAFNNDFESLFESAIRRSNTESSLSSLSLNPYHDSEPERGGEAQEDFRNLPIMAAECSEEPYYNGRSHTQLSGNSPGNNVLRTSAFGIKVEACKDRVQFMFLKQMQFKKYWAEAASKDLKKVGNRNGKRRNRFR